MAYIPIYKRCSKCKRRRERWEFYRNSKSKDGFGSWCRKCCAALARRERAKDPEKVKVSNKRYRAANKGRLLEYDRSRNRNPERRRLHNKHSKLRVARLKRDDLEGFLLRQCEYSTRYRYRNRETLKLRRAAWRAKNPQMGRAYSRSWRKRHPGAAVAASANRKSRVLNAQGRHSAADILRQLRLQKGICFYCGKSLSKGYHVDHMTPLSRGGSNGPENLVCACRRCNLSKHNKTVPEFLDYMKLVGSLNG